MVFTLTDRRRSVTPRDSQRSKLYAWERATLYGEGLLDRVRYRAELTQVEAQALVDEVWAVWVKATDPGWDSTRYGAPRVRIMGNRNRGCWSSSKWEIRLAWKYRPSLRAWYILHETAHAIVTARGLTRKIAAHGRQFCALYANLLGRFTNASRGNVARSMRAAGLKVDGRLPARTG